jgi:FkbH-like protein
LNVKDRFGDYGLVGVAILKSEDSRLSLDTLLMSCRALGRGAEESFLFTIFEFAHEQGFKQILAPYSQGPRNGQVKTFLMRMGFLEQSSNIFVANVNHAPQHPKHVTLHTQISV